MSRLSEHQKSTLRSKILTKALGFCMHTTTHSGQHQQCQKEKLWEMCPFSKNFSRHSVQICPFRVLKEKLYEVKEDFSFQSRYEICHKSHFFCTWLTGYTKIVCSTSFVNFILVIFYLRMCYFLSVSMCHKIDICMTFS